MSKARSDLEAILVRDGHTVIADDYSSVPGFTEAKMSLELASKFLGGTSFELGIIATAKDSARLVTMYFASEQVPVLDGRLQLIALSADVRSDVAVRSMCLKITRDALLTISDNCKAKASDAYDSRGRLIASGRMKPMCQGMQAEAAA